MENPKHNNESLVHCIFTCSTRELLDQGGFSELVRRQNSHAANITGLVVYEQGNAFQVLEGPKLEIDQLYQAACRNSSYGKVVKIVEEAIDDRDFDGLYSAYGLSAQGGIPGHRHKTPMFTRRDDAGRVCIGRASRLLRDFALGKWRLRAG